MNCQLISRNIVVDGRRTSIRLEAAAWDAIEDICRLEGIDLNQLCTIIEARRTNGSRTSAVRSYIISYFHQLALSASGNAQAGGKGSSAAAG